jgi:hypothetical protein
MLRFLFSNPNYGISMRRWSILGIFCNLDFVSGRVFPSGSGKVGDSPPNEAPENGDIKNNNNSAAVLASNLSSRPSACSPIMMASLFSALSSAGIWEFLRCFWVSRCALRRLFVSTVAAGVGHVFIITLVCGLYTQIYHFFRWGVSHKFH